MPDKAEVDLFKYFKLLSFVVILFLNFSFESWSKDDSRTLFLTDEVKHHSLSKYIDVLEDPSGKLGIQDILKPRWQNKFKKRSEKKLNFGYSTSTFWARLKIKNKSNEQKVWLLSHHYYLQDEIELFRDIGEGLYVDSKTGDMYPF